MIYLLICLDYLLGIYTDKAEEKMAGVERLELPTIGFGDRCSTNWNYTPATDSNYTDAQAKVKRKCVVFYYLLTVWLIYRQSDNKTASLLSSSLSY